MLNVENTSIWEKDQRQHQDQVDVWMAWLDWEVRFVRPSWEANVTTWNLGPLGYEYSRSQLQQLLTKGQAVLMVQEVDADILREIVCLLTQRVRAGRATFLIKVKWHRGEPINERADTLAEEGRGMSDDDKRWDDRTDRMTFEVRRGDATVSSVCTNSVRNAFRGRRKREEKKRLNYFYKKFLRIPTFS